MRGFTLIELLLVIALIAILAASGAAVYGNFLVKNYLDNKTKEIVYCLKTAQTNTLSGKEDSSWGVKLSNTQIIMFKGTSYSSPGTAFDQSFDVPSSITISGDFSEVYFLKLTGNPSTTGTITISNNAGDSNQISVNEVGTVNVN